MGLPGLSLDLESTQIYSRNKAALVNILRKQGNGSNFGGLECGNLENTFGIIRPLRPAQTRINLRIRMSMDDITFKQTTIWWKNKYMNKYIYLLKIYLNKFIYL